MKKFYTEPKLLPVAEDFIEHLNDAVAYANKHCQSYVAIISFNFSQRAINRDNRTSTHAVSGDNLEDAINNFNETDESSGLYDTDFTPEVMTVVFQASL